MKEQDLRDRLSLPPELDDFKEILIQAARSGKYKPNNWLLPDGKKQDKRSQYRSVGHHFEDAIRGDYIDPEDGLDVRLKVACRMMMDYTRDKRGLIHPLDQDIDPSAHFLLKPGNLIKYQIRERDYYTRSGNESSGVDFGLHGKEED